MYVRQAYKRDEAWLLDRFEEYDLDYAGFRSRDYVIAIDDDGNECGFGCLTPHEVNGDSIGELRHITVLEDTQRSDVKHEIIHSLFEKADDEGIETLYLRVDERVPEFSFTECESVPEPVVEEESEMTVYVGTVDDVLGKKSQSEEIEELAEEFGYDDDATTKYSTN